MFDDWEGYSIVCPSANDQLMLKGTEQSMKASALIFQINKCSNDSLNKTYMGDLKCKLPHEIDDFIKRI
jgi:hypothetical protein